jgi:uncharacterized protein (UPF0335 family)
MWTNFAKLPLAIPPCETAPLAAGGTIHSSGFARIPHPRYQRRQPIHHDFYRSTNPMAETTDDRLRLLIERVERLEEEKKGISDDIRDVYNEAKAVGYDVKIMRQIVRLRKMKPDDRREMDMILDTYKAALGID